MKKKLVLFDFDGTLTCADSFLHFIKFYHGFWKFIWGMIVLSPHLIMLKLGLRKNYKVKEKVLTYFFANEDAERFQMLGNYYGSYKLAQILKVSAFRKMCEHRRHGDDVWIVTASCEEWLRFWCNKMGINLIGSHLEVQDGKITGRLLGNNCYGPEKVIRIKEKIDLKNYESIYVYGDSRGDREMLILGTLSYYRNFF